MIRIAITSDILELASSYKDDVKSGYDPIAKLTELKTNLHRNRGIKKHIAYIDDIIRHYDSIMLATPSEFDSVIRVSLSEAELSKEVSCAGKKKKKVTFYTLIVKAMGYEWIRNNIFPKYMAQLGIKCCVYCNAQYGVSIKRDKASYTSTYEIDHFKPKSKYPHLSTSFFNLQPSCGHCNQTKGDRDSLFNLYIELPLANPSTIRPFEFSLPTNKIIEFLLTQEENRLEIKLDSTDSGLLINHNQRFKVDKKYYCHKDEAAELIIKSKIYNKAYLQQLQSSFGPAIPQFYNRLIDVILGFPTEGKDVHKRPITLMKQDIAKQLGLL